MGRKGMINLEHLLNPDLSIIQTANYIYELVFN